LEIVIRYTDATGNVHTRELRKSIISGTLMIHNPPVFDVDFTPLYKHPDFKAVHFAGSLIDRMDVTPLTHNPNYHFWLGCTKYSWLIRNWAVYDRPEKIYSWDAIHHLAENQFHDRRVQQDILLALGLREYGFIDRDLTQLLRSIPPDTPQDDAKKRITKVLVKEITKSVDEGRDPICFEFEKFLTKEKKIAARVNKIVQLRNEVLENVSIPIHGSEVDLRWLWLTTFGYRILSTLGMNSKTDLEGFEKVKSLFNNLGINLRTKENAPSELNMSEELKKCIWWIVTHRGKLWGNNEVPFEQIIGKIFKEFAYERIFAVPLVNLRERAIANGVPKEEVVTIIEELSLSGVLFILSICSSPECQ